MKSLEGKVAIITGSTSGIGARTAELFVAEGARVVIVGRREDRGQQVARALGETARFIRADVTDEGDVAAMIACAVAEFGRLDCQCTRSHSQHHKMGKLLIIECSAQRDPAFRNLL